MHVLGAPPAFILSQDRTLRSNSGTEVPSICVSGPTRRSVSLSIASRTHLSLGKESTRRLRALANHPENSAVCNWSDLFDRGIRFSRFALVAGPAGRLGARREEVIYAPGAAPARRGGRLHGLHTSCRGGHEERGHIRKRDPRPSNERKDENREALLIRRTSLTSAGR